MNTCGSTSTVCWCLVHQRLWIFDLFYLPLQRWDMTIGKYGKLRRGHLDITVWWILIPTYHNDYHEINRIYPTCRQPRQGLRSVLQKQLGQNNHSRDVFFLSTLPRNLADISKVEKSNIPCTVARASYGVFNGISYSPELCSLERGNFSLPTNCRVLSHKQNFLESHRKWKDIYFIPKLFVLKLHLKTSLKLPRRLPTPGEKS